MIAAVRQVWVSIVLGCVLGVMLLPAVLWLADEGAAAYDRSHAVVEFDAPQILERTPASVTVRLTGAKLRQCTFVSINAYAQERDGLLDQINMQRVDRPQRGVTRPVGKQDFGDWIMWPADDATAVHVWTSHQCGSRLVQRKVAEVIL